MPVTTGQRLMTTGYGSAPTGQHPGTGGGVAAQLCVFDPRMGCLSTVGADKKRRIIQCSSLRRHRGAPEF